MGNNLDRMPQDEQQTQQYSQLPGQAFGLNSADTNGNSSPFGIKKGPVAISPDILPRRLTLEELLGYKQNMRSMDVSHERTTVKEERSMRKSYYGSGPVRETFFDDSENLEYPTTSSYASPSNRSPPCKRHQLYTQSPPEVEIPAPCNRNSSYDMEYTPAKENAYDSFVQQHDDSPEEKYTTLVRIRARKRRRQSSKSKRSSKKYTTARKRRRRSQMNSEKPRHKPCKKVPGWHGVFSRTALNGSKKYFSLVTINGTKMYRGSYLTERACAFAYDKLVLEYRGPNARRNFPSLDEDSIHRELRTTYAADFVSDRSKKSSQKKKSLA